MHFKSAVICAALRRSAEAPATCFRPAVAASAPRIARPRKRSVRRALRAPAQLAFEFP